MTNLEFKRSHEVGQAYIFNGFEYVNDMRYCMDCECDTIHATTTNIQDHTNSAGTKRLIIKTENRDCLACMNTHGECIDRQYINLGEAS